MDILSEITKTQERTESNLNNIQKELFEIISGLRLITKEDCNDKTCDIIGDKNAC